MDDRVEGHFRVADPDLLARLAEQDPRESVVALAGAGELGVRPEALSRGFRREFGVSPKQFRLEARARCAWLEIMRSPRTLTTIAHGWTDRPDGKTVSFSDCDKGEMMFGNEPGRRIAFDVRDTVFENNGVKLVGRLIMPKGSDKIPVVVLVHGSEHDSALESYALQRMFPAQGIGAFVYDKRGTGVSGGSYTQNFDVLAADVAAAMKEAKRLAGVRLGRIGYQGGSEGGWVVPLAANRAPVDFAIVSFGLAVTILEEDQEGVALDMYFHHHSSADTTKALELARAGERVIETGDKEGYEAFDALRQKYKSDP